MSLVYSKTTITMMMMMMSDTSDKNIVDLDMEKVQKIKVEVVEKEGWIIDADIVAESKKDLLMKAKVRTSQIQDHMTSREAMIVGLLAAPDHRQDHQALITQEVLAREVSRNPAEVKVQPVTRQASINAQSKRPSFSPKSS